MMQKQGDMALLLWEDWIDFNILGFELGSAYNFIEQCSFNWQKHKLSTEAEEESGVEGFGTGLRCLVYWNVKTCAEL